MDCVIDMKKKLENFSLLNLKALVGHKVSSIFNIILFVSVFGILGCASSGKTSNPTTSKLSTVEEKLNSVGVTKDDVYNLLKVEPIEEILKRLSITKEDVIRLLGTPVPAKNPADVIPTLPKGKYVTLEKYKALHSTAKAIRKQAVVYWDENQKLKKELQDLKDLDLK